MPPGANVPQAVAHSDLIAELFETAEVTGRETAV